MNEWPTGPEAMEYLLAWCAVHGTTPGRLGRSCSPAVHRSIFGRWQRGQQPSRAVWARLRDGMADMEQLQRMLGG